MTRAARDELRNQVDTAVRERDRALVRDLVGETPPERRHGRCKWCPKRCVGDACPEHRDVEALWREATNA